MIQFTFLMYYIHSNHGHCGRVHRTGAAGQCFYFGEDARSDQEKGPEAIPAEKYA